MLPYVLYTQTCFIVQNYDLLPIILVYYLRADLKGTLCKHLLLSLLRMRF